MYEIKYIMLLALKKYPSEDLSPTSSQQFGVDMEVVTMKEDFTPSVT